MKKSPSILEKKIDKHIARIQFYCIFVIKNGGHLSQKHFYWNKALELFCLIISKVIMKYFLRSFNSFHWFKKGSVCQLLAKECAQILVKRLDD